MFRRAGWTGGTSGARWLAVVLFALAMAWVESAVVFYLRTMIHRIEPYQVHPLPEFGGLAPAELVRELATLIMLGTVGWLAGTTRRARLGYALIAFGVWDIFYYVFLKVLTGWPHSLLDWDILFLLPLPWWGPVLAPMAIASLMILWGTLVTQIERGDPRPCSNPRSWMISMPGIALALYLFMEDALWTWADGGPALRELLPTRFNWPMFGMALALMAAPVLEVGGRPRRGRPIPPAERQSILNAP
jgi:hypothetical protein